MLNRWYLYLHEFGERLFLPLVNYLIKFKIHPNVLTSLGLLSAVLAAYFLLSNHLLFVLFSLLHLFFDILDGLVARKRKLVTKFGAFFDYWTDRSYSILVMIIFGAYPVAGLILVYHLLNYFNKIHLYFRTGIMIGFILKWYKLTIEIITPLLLIGIFIHIIFLVKKVLKR